MAKVFTCSKCTLLSQIGNVNVKKKRGRKGIIRKRRKKETKSEILKDHGICMWEALICCATLRMQWITFLVGLKQTNMWLKKNQVPAWMIFCVHNYHGIIIYFSEVHVYIFYMGSGELLWIYVHINYI